MNFPIHLPTLVAGRKYWERGANVVFRGKESARVSRLVLKDGWIWNAEIDRMGELLINRPQIADIPGVWKWSTQKV